MKLRILILTVAILSAVSCNNQKSLPAQSFEQRADSLVAQMTLEEKVSQLCYDSPAIERLGIKKYNWWNECLHGVARAGKATVYPQAIAMAAMFDTVMMARIGNEISDEARAKYNRFAAADKRGIYQGLTFRTPNINIFRDPRWGRGMETYGEDPYLSGEYAKAFIKALQGNNPDYFKVIATAKHFAVHSGPEATRHSVDVQPSDYDFAETYTPQFKKAVIDAKVYSVMCAYNSYAGKPCCGNEYLSNLLRNEWGFDGYIVSDCWAINDFYSPQGHHVATDMKEAAAMALKAGTDLNCGNSYPALVEAVKAGLIDQSVIDKAVKRLLVARMKLGMFDKNVPFDTISYNVVNSKQHIETARLAACKSMVLLKNDNKTLPFGKNIRKIAVIGPNADDADMQLANYNGFAPQIITTLQGIKNKLPDAEVIYEPGCPIVENLPVNKLLKLNNLKAEYFNNKSFSGRSISVDYNEINIRLFEQSPLKGINADTFSVKFKGTFVAPETGSYVFSMKVLPFGKLLIDNKVMIEPKAEAGDNSMLLEKRIDMTAGKQYDIELDYYCNSNPYAVVQLLCEMPDKQRLARAVKAAQQADVVVMCLGLNPMMEGEEASTGMGFARQDDKKEIELPAVQRELAAQIMKLNKPTVMILNNGGAMAFPKEAETVPAILEAWYPGEQGGNAVADILFGDYNPSGRLPVTFYKSTSDLPDFNSYDMTGRTYRYFTGDALYPFGYGKSFSYFKYFNISSSPAPGGDIKVVVNVKNEGDFNGDEVSLLYVSHLGSKYKTAIKSLKGFKRTFIKKGETVKLEFIVAADDLKVRDEKNNLVKSDVKTTITINDLSIVID